MPESAYADDYAIAEQELQPNGEMCELSHIASGWSGFFLKMAVSGVGSGGGGEAGEVGRQMTSANGKRGTDIERGGQGGQRVAWEGERYPVLFCGPGRPGVDDVGGSCNSSERDGGVAGENGGGDREETSRVRLGRNLGLVVRVTLRRRGPDGCRKTVGHEASAPSAHGAVRVCTKTVIKEYNTIMVADSDTH